MSSLKLFSLKATSSNEMSATEINGSSYAKEKELQKLIERNLETMFGIRFLASEHVTDYEHGGRIDTVGIDENGCPAIIEYKRSMDQNVITQGLFYLDCLDTHRGNFEILALKKIGKETDGESTGRLRDLSASQGILANSTCTQSSKSTEISN